MSSKVIPFSRKVPQPESPWQRLWAAAGYIALAWLLYVLPNWGINLFLLLGIVYWAFIQQRRHDFSAFMRYHWLQAMVLFFMLYLLGRLALAVLQFAQATIELFGLSAITLLADLLGWLIAAYVLATHYGFWAVGIVLAVQALLGQVPRVPVIGPIVDRWL